MKRPQLLVLDLDGTTLVGRDELRDDDREAALRLKAAGIPVTIATGRLLGGTAWVSEALGVDGPFAIMNGSAHVTSGTLDVHLTHALAETDLAGWSDRLTAASLPVFHFGIRSIHRQLHAERYDPYLKIWTPQLEVAPHTDGVLALSTAGSHDQIHDLARQIREVPHLDARTFDTFDGECWMEVRIDGVDKGTAVDELSRAHGLTAADTVVVGDWHNDVPMFRRAGRSFVMNGAVPEVADHATDRLQSRAREGGAIAEVARVVWGL